MSSWLKIISLPPTVFRLVHGFACVTFLLECAQVLQEEKETAKTKENQTKNFNRFTFFVGGGGRGGGMLVELQLERFFLAQKQLSACETP